MQVSSHELEAYNGDGIPQVVHETKYELSDLLPGRNYSISVVALSQGIPSDAAVIYQATRKFTFNVEHLFQCITILGYIICQTLL